ncbi:MAG: phage holin family protein [Planctomycetes bacterium]|nr:phage holin family protein [Planctomycetota bacterium]
MIDTRQSARRDAGSSESSERTASANETMTELVSGIVGDVQDLIKQQLALFKRELQEDIRKTKEGMLSLVIGGAVLAVGGMLLCLMLVHLLHWAWPALPLWNCFAIVGGVFALVGGLLACAGYRQLKSNNPLPDETVAALKENVQWIANPK